MTSTSRTLVAILSAVPLAPLSFCVALPMAINEVKAVNWGLDYGPGFRDAMHFEVKASAAAVSRAAARLTTGWVTVSSDFLNGRSKPSTTAPIKFLRTKGFRIRFVEVAYREGRIWLRTKFNTWYAADLTTW